MKKLLPFLIFSFYTIISFGQINEVESIDKIFSDWDKENVPGCAVGIIKDDKLVYAKGFGYANLEYDIPNSANSVFRIASTSKQFTAACIVLLAEQGKLGLDSTLDQFFPAFPDYAKTITIQHLLNHTSGIRDYLTLSQLKNLGNDDHYVDEDIMDWLVNQSELNFNPGDDYLYSNSGYWLLGQIVNQVSEMNMADFAEEQIFKPLQMSSTHFHNNHSKIVKNRASGYMPIDQDSYQISMTTLDMIGDGGIFTSINDIQKWDAAYYDRSVLSDAFWNMMTRQGVLNNGDEIDYASGLGIATYKGLNTISHGGAFVGFRAELVRFPDQKTSIAIFTNRGDANPTSMAYQIADIVLKDKFEKAVAETSSKDNKVQTFVNLSTDELEKFAGNYINMKSFLARKIYVKNDTLRYFRSISNESDLVPISKNEFKMINVNSDVVVSFDIDRSGKKKMTFVANNSSPSVSDEYSPIKYDTKDLHQFEGSYYSKELDIHYALKVEDNLLTLYIDDTKVAPLTEIMADLFTLSNYLTLQFNKDSMGKVIDFRLAAGRVKNLLFKKQ